MRIGYAASDLLIFTRRSLTLRLGGNADERCDRAQTSGYPGQDVT